MILFLAEGKNWSLIKELGCTNDSFSIDYLDDEMMIANACPHILIERYQPDVEGSLPLSRLYALHYIFPILPPFSPAFLLSSHPPIHAFPSILRTLSVQSAFHAFTLCYVCFMEPPHRSTVPHRKPSVPPTWCDWYLTACLPIEPAPKTPALP